MSGIRIKQGCVLVGVNNSRVVFSTVEEIQRDSMVIYKEADVIGIMRIGTQHFKILHIDSISAVVD